MKLRLNEDWLATIIGIALLGAVLIGLGGIKW